MAILNPKPAGLFPALMPLSMIRMVWKRKIPIVLVWAAVSIVTCIVVLRIPHFYSAEALILVDSQKIPDRYVSSTVVSDAQDRLAAISQQILSSGRLEKIIEDFNLYRQERLTHFREDIVAMMRRDIQATPEKTWNGRTASFRISYEGRDPVVVAQVANKIASLYVEENLKARENQAEGTSEFIETQLKEAKQKLDELEAAVSQYKLRHNGELPQQEGSLNGILSRLGVALEANRDAINRAQQQKAIVQDSLSIAEASEASQVKALHQAAADANRTANSAAAVPGVAPPRPRKPSEELQAQLDELRLRYSDSHPEIRRLRVLLDQTRREEARRAPDPPEEKRAVLPAAPRTQTPPAPQPVIETHELMQTRERLASLKAQMEIANQEIETRKKEQQRILSEISLYQGRVNTLPIREQEMAGLTRDYEITKANYRSLLDKRIAAEMATDMERREKSERFTIVDPARVPVRPSRPNRKMLAMEGSLLGLLLGVALGFGKELQAATLLGEWELPAGTNILGRLPHIKLAPPETRTVSGTKKRSKLKLAILPAALVALLGLVIAGVHLAAHGS